MGPDLRDTAPKILYHYTTQAGFLGIIQSQSLWATDMRYLNDKREYLLAMELLSERVKSLAVQSAGSPPALYLEKLQERLANIWSWQFFVVSFSEDGDLLSQWRGYGQGGGYALGFRGDDLVARLQAQGWTLASCVYDSAQQVALIDQLLATGIARLEDPDSALPAAPPSSKPTPPSGLQPSFDPDKIFPMPPPSAPHWMTEAFPALISAFFLNGPRIKDDAFREEREWRAISPRDTHGQVRVRPGVGVLRPYIPLSLEPFSLAELVVGPSSHQDLARQAAEVALSQYQVHCDSVRLSKVPYRDW